LDFPQAKTSVCVQQKTAVETVELESGLGAASMLLFSCVMVKLRSRYLWGRMGEGLLIEKADQGVWIILFIE
jgi:hypothetical protein